MPSAPVAKVLARLPSARPSGGQWKALCPAHDDHNPSLSVGEGADGRAILNCFTGCARESIAAALGLEMWELFVSRTSSNGAGAPRPTESDNERLLGSYQPQRGDGASPAAHQAPAEPQQAATARRIAATYDYHDAGGETRFRVVRFEPKGFGQWRPDGRGGWIRNMRGVERVLYKLPELIQAVAEEHRVAVAEGEKGVHALEALGFVATCSPGGAGKWRAEYREHFRAAHVIIFPDNDAPGRKHGEQVARSLNGVAASIKIVKLPDLPDAGDIWDWLEAGGTVEELNALIESAPAWSAPLADHTDDVRAAALRKKKDSTLVIEQLVEAGVIFWHTSTRTRYASVPVGGHIEHWKVDDDFADFLANHFYRWKGRPLSAQAIAETLRILRAKASEGDQHEMYVRIAGDHQTVFLDLANAGYEVAKITGSGTEIVIPDAGIRFLRPSGILALPRPEPGGSVNDLRPFVNVSSDDDFRLLIAWIIWALQPSGPYPLLYLLGPHGAAKTTTERVIASLIDPSEAQTRSLPRNEEDLSIAADHAHVLSFDNASHLPYWLSDALCRIATGASFAVRRLYQNREQEIFKAIKPIIINGIAPIITRPDLGDRAIIVNCPAIAPPRRKDERTFWREYEEARPRILGALLQAVSAAIRNLPSTPRDGLPRMADFARWVIAAEPALGWPEGAFLSAYTANRSVAVEEAAENDMVVQMIHGLVSEQAGSSWTGSMRELLAELNREPSIENTRRRRNEARPDSPERLTAHLSRVIDRLGAVGIEMERLTRTRNARPYKFTRVSGATDGPPW